MTGRVSSSFSTTNVSSSSNIITPRGRPAVSFVISLYLFLSPALLCPSSSSSPSSTSSPHHVLPLLDLRPGRGRSPRRLPLGGIRLSPQGRLRRRRQPADGRHQTPSARVWLGLWAAAPDRVVVGERSVVGFGWAICGWVSGAAAGEAAPRSKFI